MDEIPNTKMFQQQHQWGAWCSSNMQQPWRTQMSFAGDFPDSSVESKIAHDQRENQDFGVAISIFREAPIRPPDVADVSQNSEAVNCQACPAGRWAPLTHRLETDCSTAVLKSRVCQGLCQAIFWREANGV